MDAEPGIDPSRVAEVIVTGPGGAGRRGSGYRVASGVVLTAAHVVAGARSVRLRFDADTDQEWSVTAAPAEVAADPGSDLAAVRFTGPDAVLAGRYGRIGERPDPVTAHAVGFPRFKLKDYADPDLGSYRDSHHAICEIPPFSNRRSGTLELTVVPPDEDPDPAVSPWEGMSGAAVWADGRIVGVVTEHRRSESLGRLTAARITALVDKPSDGARRLRDVLGIPAAVPDVTAPLPPATYLLQVGDIAPERLLGREEELRELAGFTGPHGWWEGSPWAGKTALMAAFALDAPADVAVVPFFVGAVRVGGSDGDAFLAAVTEQLAALAQRAPGSGADRRRGFLALLDAAARRCREDGRRLLLVVDAIDEDTGPESGAPSIASLLPRHPPAGVAVLVTSRPGRPLPADVPADHPLHGCPRRRLTVSPHAQEVEQFALTELRDRLRAGSLHEDLIGLVTASGGGLTSDDLAELTGASPVAVADLLAGAFGGSVATRSPRPGGTARGYVLAHRTFREVAARELGTRLDGYRARLWAWCDEHRRRGWPVDTPAYLLQDHPRLLAAAGDVDRLAELAIDPQRHARLLEVTGGDAAALDEIALAQLVNLRRAEPDLATAVLLAVRREELTSRNRHVPVRLPAVWAAVGRGDRAAALARGLPRPQRRNALAAAALAAAAAGHLGDAESLAWRVPDRDRRDAVFGGMAAAAAGHDPVRAARWAQRCSPIRRADALARIAATLAGRDPERAEAAVAALAGAPPDVRARPLVAAAVATVRADRAALEPALRDGGRTRAELAVALAEAGDTAWAEEVLAGIRRPGARLTVLAVLVRTAVEDGDDEAAGRHLAALRRTVSDVAKPGDAVGELLALACAVSDRAPAVAEGLVAAAEALADRVPEDRREWASARLAVAHAATGGTARAEALLDRVTHPDRAATALAGIAADAARRGDARRAESVVRRVPGAGRRMHALADVAAAFAAAGDHRRAAARAAEAEGMARRTTNPARLATLCSRVVDGLVAVDELAAAVEVADQIADPRARGDALTRVAEALAALGVVEHAVAIARALDAERRSWALVAVCEAQAAAGSRDAVVATAAQVLAEPAEDDYTRVVALLRLATALHSVDAAAEARRLRSAAADQVVEDVADPGRRARAFAHLSVALAAAGDADGAQVLARRTAAELAAIQPGARADRARRQVVEELAAAGHPAWAEELAGSIAGPAARIRALAALATAVGGDRAWTLLDRAGELLADVGRPEDRWGATGRYVQAGAVLVADDGPDGSRRSHISRQVAELLATDGWAEAIPALARLDWEAFDALVDWLATRTAPGAVDDLG